MAVMTCSAPSCGDVATWLLRAVDVHLDTGAMPLCDTHRDAALRALEDRQGRDPSLVFGVLPC